VTTLTTGEQAVSAALAAGFQITFYALNDHSRIYYHELSHTDGRGLVINTRLDGGAFVGALGTNRRSWATWRLSVDTLPDLRLLIADQASARRRTHE
jgi:hypothetical protein